MISFILFLVLIAILLKQDPDVQEWLLYKRLKRIHRRTKFKIKIAKFFSDLGLF